MAVYEEELLAVSRVEARALPLRRAAALLVALAAGVLFAVRLDLPGFFDNEGRYAEVAREMLQSGDWLSPHLDFRLFLNKPPLAFWLTSLVFSIGGPSEWGRLVPVAAAVVALFATARLGALLYGEAAGVVAAIALASSLGFVLEARTLRPDMIVTATVVLALLWWLRAERNDGRRGAWLVGLWTALGVGMLAKGFVPVVLAGIPIATVTVLDHGWRGVRRLRPGVGLLVLAAIVLPWHVAVALRHPGFAWDYVVNQHLLFFLDRKLPRDSEGDSLVFFWTAFVGRGFPWTMFLPLTVGEALRGWRRVGTDEARATFVLWIWLGGALAFFSCAPSRLEHYSIPALPAVAILAARVWQRAAAGTLHARAWRYVVGLGAVATSAGLAGAVFGERLLRETYWIAQVPSLLALALPAAAVVVVTGLGMVFAATARRPAVLVGVLAAAMLPAAAIVLRAEVDAEPLFSWRPVARALGGAASADTEIVFEAPDEYQLVGGLAYYTGRRITLLEPPGGFVPPTYLAGQMDGMFLSRAAFARRWQAGERLAFVSDPQRRREDPATLVPGPFRVVGRFGDRWVLTSVPPGVG